MALHNNNGGLIVAVIIALLLFSPFALLAQATAYPAPLNCVSMKSQFGDRITPAVAASFKALDIRQQTFYYKAPAPNCEGIAQELFVVVLKDENAARIAADTVDRTLVYIHGGGFRGGSAFGENAGSFAENAVPLGYDFVSIEYRTGWVLCEALPSTNVDFCGTDSTRFYDCIKYTAYVDIVDAMTYLKDNAAGLGISPNFYLTGTSAGGAAVQLLCMDPYLDDWRATSGIKAGLIAFGGGALTNLAPGPRRYTVPLMVTHNDNDDIAPWSGYKGTGGQRNLQTNVNLPRNFGAFDVYDTAIAVRAAGGNPQVYFMSRCGGGHGFQLGDIFGAAGADREVLFGEYGFFSYFIPLAEAGTFGIQRVVFPTAAPPATWSIPKPYTTADQCPCETSGNGGSFNCGPIITCP